MAKNNNFNINLKINVEKGNSEQQVDAIKKSLEDKKIQLKLDTSLIKTELSDLKTSLSGINKSLNDAFKLNKGNLQNLQDLKTVLSEINKLSKKTKINVTNPKDVSQVTSDLEQQKNKYVQLLKLKQSLEKQMASTSNATSYRNLKEQLALVTKEAEQCKTKLSTLQNLKLKTDITKSMTSQFQSVQKEAKNLKTSLENTLKNTNVTSEQKKKLEELLATINKVSQTRFRLKTSDAEAQIQKLVQEIKDVSSKYSNIKMNITATSNIDKTQKSINKMLNTLKLAQKTKVGANSFINAKDLDKLIVKAEKLKQDLKNVKMTDNVASETAKIVKELDTINNKFKSLQNTAKIDMKLSGGVTSANKQIDTLISKIKTIQSQKIGGNAFVDESKLSNLMTKLESYRNALKSLDVNSETVVAEFEQIRNSIERTDNELKELQSHGSFNLKLAQGQNSIDAVANQIDRLEQKARRLGADASQVDKFRQELERISQLPLGQQTAELGKLKNQISNASIQMNNLGSSVRKTNTFFGNLYSSMATYSLGNIISMQMTKAIYGVIDTIRELDKAFVNFNKVAPESFHGTKAEFDDLREKAIQVGQDVARSSVDIINSTASAVQLGVDKIDKALEYARGVNLYANVGDMTEEEADTYLKSVMSAYGGVNESLDVFKSKVDNAYQSQSIFNDFLDQANYLGNNYALTTKDVGEAMMRSASSLSSAGLSMSETMGMIISAQETTQDASKVGNSLKSLAVNLQGIKTNARTGALELNKTAMALKKYANIDIVGQNGDIKSSFDVLTELSNKWDELDEKTKAGLSEAVAGKIINILNLK